MLPAPQAPLESSTSALTVTAQRLSLAGRALPLRRSQPIGAARQEENGENTKLCGSFTPLILPEGGRFALTRSSPVSYLLKGQGLAASGKGRSPDLTIAVKVAAPTSGRHRRQLRSPRPLGPLRQTSGCGAEQ